MGISGNVIRFPGHKWYHCGPGCEGCMFCEGGLGACVVCGGAEGSLPTDCPGERMTRLTEQMVYSGDIDYRRKEGWTTGFKSRNCPRWSE